MKLIFILILIIITAINGQFLSSLLSLTSGLNALASLPTGGTAAAFPGVAYAGLSGNGIQSIAAAPGGIAAGNIFGNSYLNSIPSNAAIQNFVDRSIIESLNSVQKPSIPNYNVGIPQTYNNDNFWNTNFLAPAYAPVPAPVTARPVRPAFQYPSIKNSLNTADSSLKGISTPHEGGLSNPQRPNNAVGLSNPQRPYNVGGLSNPQRPYNAGGLSNPQRPYNGGGLALTPRPYRRFV